MGSPKMTLPTLMTLTVKFGFSEKATIFEKIFVVLLTRVSCSVHATAYLSKTQQRFFKTNVVILYYTNFIYKPTVNKIGVKYNYKAQNNEYLVTMHMQKQIRMLLQNRFYFKMKTVESCRQGRKRTD